MKKEIKLEDFTDEYVLGEIKKLKYTYGLNKVIRYNLDRQEKHQTQSVAEHICNMIFLAHYFKDLEDPENKMDFAKVIRIIMMHDMGEIETGDIITVAKTSLDEDLERAAVKNVKLKSPSFIAREIDELFEEFENPKTLEGKFARAIDKLEGQIFWIEKEGVEMVKFIDAKAGLDINIVYPILMEKIFKQITGDGFLFIKRFLEVIHQEKMKTGIILTKKP